MLVHEVFDKVLYLTPSARAQFSSGRIFNLVTTDAETLQMLFQNILGVISSPARIIGSMAMLYVQLGPSSLVALAVLILMMPAQVRNFKFSFVIPAFRGETEYLQSLQEVSRPLRFPLLTFLLCTLTQLISLS